MDKIFLSQTKLFQGIGSDEADKLLKCLLAEEKIYKKGTYLFYVGEQTSKIGILMSGKLSIEHDDLWGNRTILNMITPGDIFLENYACISNEPLMVSVTSTTTSKVVFLDVSHLLQPCDNHCSFHNKIIRNLLTISANKNLTLSRRSFHTASKTIRGRLLSYLSYEASKIGEFEFDIPFNRQQLADYLNIDRSALSNELGKMKRDGLLTFHKNHFVISKDHIDEI